MAPLVRRTWAPIGKTPILVQRTRSHDKVSVVAALTISPARRRVGLYFSMFPGRNITTAELIHFLRHVRQQLGGPMIAIWDRLAAHRSMAMQKFIQSRADIWTEYLPPYAPELNPVELVWSYFKMNPLANLAAQDSHQLCQIAGRAGRRICRDEQLLRSFMKGTPLSLRLR